MTPFHLSFQVDDLARARDFYGRVLGCAEAASAPTWVDYDFFGHQLSLHTGGTAKDSGRGTVDGQAVPMPHFGVVLAMPEWHALAIRLRDAGVPFVLAPQVRYAGEPREQGTFFVRDPSGHALEFKAMRDPAQLFAPALHD